MRPAAADHGPVNAAAQFVFGYGSLAVQGEGCHVARLRGHRRVWGVAMDNAVDVPGYKSYRLRSDGSRPAVFVAFLDIEPDPRDAVTGLCLPVDEWRLRELDLRERNYERVDVSSAIDAAQGRVWTYRGSAAGRARLRDAVAHGCAAVSRDYRDGVLAELREIVPADELAAVSRDIGMGGLAVLDLQRVEVAALASHRHG